MTMDALREADSRARRELLTLGWSRDKVEDYLSPLETNSSAEAPLGDVPDASDMRAAAEVLGWLRGERSYQMAKFGVAADDEHTKAGLGQDQWWWRQLTTYFHRAGVLGLENELGRQALAKFVSTSCGLLESVVRLYGHLPPPGVPSGYNVTKNGK